MAERKRFCILTQAHFFVLGLIHLLVAIRIRVNCTFQARC